MTAHNNRDLTPPITSLNEAFHLEARASLSQPTQKRICFYTKSTIH